MAAGLCTLETQRAFSAGRRRSPAINPAPPSGQKGTVIVKILVWAVFALLAALWTLGAVVTVELAQWSAQFLASGTAADLGRSAAQLPVPQWIALWLDPAWIQAAQAGLVWSLEALRSALPFIGSAIGWVTPLVWIVWGVGMAGLLLLGGVGHWLVGRVAQ